MASWLRTVAFPEGPSSVPSTYVRRLPTACNLSPRGLDTLLGLLRYSHTGGTQTHECIYIKIKTKLTKKHFYKETQLVYLSYW